MVPSRFAAAAVLLSLVGIMAGCGERRLRASITDASEDFPTSDGLIFSLGFDATSSTDDGGQGTGGPAAYIPPQPIAFGDVACGDPSGSTQTFPIFNGGGAPLTVSALATGPGFTVTPASISVPPGASGSFTVGATVDASAVAGTPLSGTLLLTTNDPATPAVNVPLAVVPSGGKISVRNASAGAFPTSELHAVVQRPIEIDNSGNAPLTLTLSQPQDPHFVLQDLPDGGEVQVAPGGSWTASLSFTADDMSPRSSTLAFVITGTSCGTSVASVALSGQGGRGAITGWPTAPFDVGPAPCGGAPPAPQSFTLSNTTAVDAEITGVSVFPRSFTVDTQAGDKVPAHGTLDVTVTAPAVPSPSPLTPITATLTVLTDTDDAPVVTTLQEDPQGAVLSFDTSVTSGFGSFGEVVLLSSATQGFRVVNQGNGPASVTLSMASGVAGDGGVATGDASPTDDGGADGASGSTPVFSLATLTFSVPPLGAQTDVVRFTPATGGSAVDALTMKATGAICASLPTPLPVSGVGLGGGLAIAPSQLAFTPTCGGGPPNDQVLTLTNVGPADLHWAIGPVTGPGAGQYTVTPLRPPGLLPPNQQAGIRISAAAIPSPAPNPDPRSLAASFTLTTDAPLDAPHVVPLSETPLGDRLSVSTELLRYGQYPIDHLAPAQSFTVTNAANPGSPPARLTLVMSGATQQTTVQVFPEDAGLVCIVPPDGGADADAAPYCSVPEAASSEDGEAGEGGDRPEPPTVVVDGYVVTPLPMPAIAAGTASGPEAVSFVPTAAVPYDATLKISTSDALCSPLPDPIRLMGTGTDGQVSVSAAAIAFGTDPGDPLGLVNCGATGLPKTLWVTNFGNQPFNITGLSLGRGASSPFTLSGPATALPVTVPLFNSVELTITPSAIPAAVADPNDASLFADTLTLTTDATLDKPHAVALAMQARGAVITGSPVSLNWTFGTIPLGSIGTYVIGIRNVGNAPASATMQGLLAPSIFGLKDDPQTIAANGITALTGQFDPPVPGEAYQDEGTLVVGAPQGLCQPVPAAWTNQPVTFSGSASSNPPIVLSGSLAFPATDCGNAPPAAQAMTLTNMTNQPYAYALSFASGALYTLADPGPGNIASGGSVTVLVSPVQITPGPGVQAGAAPYADSLLVATHPMGPDASGGAASPSFTIPISWSLDGAVLTLPQGRNVGGSPADSTAGVVLAMANAGTKDVTISFATQPSNALTWSPASSLVPAAGSTSAQVYGTGSNPACPSSAAASLSFFYSGPVCQPFASPSIALKACSGAL